MRSALPLYAAKTAPRTTARRRLYLAALVSIFAATAAAGMWVRVAGVPSRFFWCDEAVTALRVSGHTSRDSIMAIANGAPRTAAQILRFAGRGEQRGLSDTVRSLASEDAQHPPLFYLATAVWTRAAGASIAQLRVPALVFGVLVPFAIAWLCWELYGTLLAAVLGFALAALSPVLVVQSQEAREYGLWALLFALCTACLLRASRTAVKRWWVAYGIFAVLGLYADAMFGVTLLAHAVYAALLLRGSRLRNFIVGVGAALALFLPWLLTMASHADTILWTNRWSAAPWPLAALAKAWMFNAGTAFFDLEYANHRAWIVVLLLAVLTACAILWNLTRTAKRSRTLTAALLLLPVLTLLGPDLLFHAHRSSITRYGMPLWVMLLVCVAGFLASRIRLGQSVVRAWWTCVAAVLVMLCAVSSLVDAKSTFGWDNDSTGWIKPVAQQVNASENSLLVIPAYYADVLDFAFYLKPQVRVLVISTLPNPAALRGYRTVYLLGLPASAPQYERALGCCVTNVPVAMPGHLQQGLMLMRRQAK